MACPLKFWRAKNVQNLARFLTTFDIDREYVRNGSTNQKFGKVVGLQTKKLLTCILTHPSGHFSGVYISALRGCCAVKFLHSLEIDQCCLAHTSAGTVAPPPNFKRKNLKFGLKFSVCTSMTSGLMGIWYDHKFLSRRRVARQRW